MVVGRVSGSPGLPEQRLSDIRLELAFVDLPKIALFRTLAALIAVFWLIEWSLPSLSTERRGAANLNIQDWSAGAIQHLKILRTWVFEHRSRWVIAAAALFLLSTLLSTALSVSFSVSVWGLVPGLDSYPAYTVLAHILLFAAVATLLKTRNQLARLMVAVVSMAVLLSGYAVAQHFGIDPFELLDLVQTSRATSTLGNAIVAGSVLVLTFPLTLAAAVITLDQPVMTKQFWSRFLGWSPLLGVQLLGLIFTFSRGPWLSAIAGLVGLLGLILLFAGWRNCFKGLLVLGAAAGLCVLTVFATQGIQIGERPASPSGPVSQETLAPSRGITEATTGRDVAQRFTSVGREVAQGGLSGRLQIWQASQMLILQRPWFEFEDLDLPWLRAITGYGPDLFKYTYLIERRPQPATGRLVSERYAHN